MNTLQIDKGVLYNAYFYLRRYSPYFHHLDLISDCDVNFTIALFKDYLSDFGIADLDIQSKDVHNTIENGRYYVSGWYNYYRYILTESKGKTALNKLSELGILRAFYVVMLKDFLNYRDLDNHDYMKRLILGEEGTGVLSYKDILGYAEYRILTHNELSKDENTLKYTESLGKSVADILKEFIETESYKNGISQYVNLNPIDYQSDYTALEGKDGPREITDYIYVKPFPTRICNILYWIIHHLENGKEVIDSDLDMVSKFEEIPSLYDKGIRERLRKAIGSDQ